VTAAVDTQMVYITLSQYMKFQPCKHADLLSLSIQFEDNLQYFIDCISQGANSIVIALIVDSRNLRIFNNAFSTAMFTQHWMTWQNWNAISHAHTYSINQNQTTLHILTHTTIILPFTSLIHVFTKLYMYNLATSL